MNKTIFEMNAEKIYRKRAALAGVKVFIACVCALAVISSGCRHDEKQPDNKSAPANAQPSGTADAAQIIERYRALDDSSDSIIRMRASIKNLGTDAEYNAPPVVEMIMYQKREPDGVRKMFAEFISPAEERDRDALITINPQGDIEGMRYTQSSGKFITSKDVMVEESLFGMTMQELAGGQPEKYDFKVAGEETFNNSPVYRMEGKLKAGAESKFPRLVLLISKENSAALSAEFYDNKNVLARTITINEAKPVEGHWTRMRWTVDNQARQRQVNFETLEARYNQKIDDSTFTPDNLKKKATK